jgi:hypothetical protein
MISERFDSSISIVTLRARRSGGYENWIGDFEMRGPIRQREKQQLIPTHGNWL